MSDGPSPRLTILVVDDDPFVRRALERSLKHEPRLAARDVEVLTAPDGRKALALIDERAPDVVVTDLFMPRMDGFALCRALRGAVATEGLPIVVVSGVYKDPRLVADLTREVAAHFLAKPVDVGALAELLLDLVNRDDRGTLRGHPAVPAETAGDPMVAGAIAERPVADLLLRHLELRSTGTLLLVRGQMRKELFLREGRTVAAESNMRQETLGMLLVSKGVIDEEQLNFLLAEAKRTEQKMGEVLVNLGWLSPEDVLKYLASQARRRVADALRWTEGSYSFIPGEDFAERVIEHDFDVARLTFTALARTALPDAAAARFDLEEARVVIPSPRIEAYREIFEGLFGPRLLALLAEPGARTAGELLAGADAAQLAVALEALVLTGLVELGAATNESMERSRPLPGDSFSLERLKGTQLLPAQPSRVNTSGGLPELLDDFDEGPHVGLDASASRSAVAHQMLAASDSELVTLGPSSTSAIAAALPVSDDARQMVLREYLRIHGKPLYDVLGVPRNPTPQQVRDAHHNKAQRFAPGHLDESMLGAEATKLTSLRAAYDRALRVLSDPTLRGGYDQTLRHRLEGGDALGAELSFHQGLVAFGDGNFAAALPHFEAAIEARQDQSLYHAFFGWTLYRAHGAHGAERARAVLERAIALDPGQPDGHTFLGRLAADTGDEETARKALDRALVVDPTREEALDELVRIYERSSEHHATERLYRRLVHDLGERALPLRRRLWKQLAALYEDEFENRASARIAYEVAARLAPDDLALQQKVVEFNQEDPTRWKELSRALAAEWRLRPEDLELGSALTDLYLRVGQHDAATIAAAALVLRGSASTEIHQLAESHRPRLLARIARPLTSEVSASLRHASEDQDLEALFCVLAEEGLLPPFSDDDIGLTAGTELTPAARPPTFARVLNYVCHVLQVPEPPRIFSYAPLAQDARIADTRPTALLVGPALLESTDTVELGFRLARALSFSNPGRVAGSSRPGRQLRPYLLAGMAVARRTLTSEARLDAGLTATFESARAVVRHRISDLGARLLRERTAISLSAWARSMNRTATRLGLLICADPLRVGRAVAEEEGPEALEDLLDFALTPEHVELRAQLGLAAVV